MLIIVLLGVLAVPPMAPHVEAQTGTAEPASPLEDPDALYADRERLASADRAATIWEKRLADGVSPFESAWKLSRACYWLGGHVSANARRHYERGIEAARRAAALEPTRPEGYFWTAANMGALAESSGMQAGLRYRGAIKDALETVLRLDPSFQQGSADRALGRWYDKVPRLFGGSDRKAVEHLEKSLIYNPISTASYFFLGEALLAMDRDAEARHAFQKVLEVPLDPEWAPEDREFKQKAQAAVARLK